MEGELCKNGEMRPVSHWIPRGFQAAAGLLVCAMGGFLQIRADIGVSPWDTLFLGIAGHTGFTYGQVCIAISFLIVFLDLALREKIGLGTVLDAFLVGWGVDLYSRLFPAGAALPYVVRTLQFIAGTFVICIGQYIYMKAALCFGPKDALLVALARRSGPLPIGAVNVLLFGCVLAAGVLLGGPAGPGTVIAAFGTGPALQLVCRAFRFDPKKTVHQGFKEMLTGC